METEYQAAKERWAWAPADFFAAITVEGPDARDFLNRLLTNEVPNRPGEGRHAYYLTVQGRPLAEFRIFAEEKGFFLVVPASQATTALQELDKMHFGEKMRMAASPLRALILTGPSRPQASNCDWKLDEVEWQAVSWRRTRFPYLASASDVLWASAPEVEAVLDNLDGVRMSPDILEVLRIEAGTATPRDIGEKTMFLEIAGSQAFSETKGCYPGQEVVARTLHRGHINRKLCRLRLPGSPLPGGTVLRHLGKEIGKLSSVVSHPKGGSLALGFLRREVWEPGLALEMDGSTDLAIVEEGV